MGLIHSRASKKRDKAEAKLLEEQRKAVKRESRASARENRQEKLAQAEEPGRHPLRQPTVGAALREVQRRRKAD